MSERMCEQIVVLQVPKISSQKSVEAVTIFLPVHISERMCEQNWGLSSSQDLKPGECRGSQMCPSGANFLMGCVNRCGSLKCP